ncbi:efflux RND transporter permease subunit [Candidatus Gracilibacteria bacterium 28_42_T64]|nr:efflux RND transporter permease subunit [Candidatus Gracilibacteria bacterium 28_42_T64]
MSNTIEKINQKIEKGFFGFWVKKFRVSFLAIFLIIVAGAFSLVTIPKESSPDIKFGVISVVTPYIGVNPTDIDSLITDKIEKEIKDLDGIKKITSRSSVGVSSITVELHNGVETRNVLTDIKDEIDKISLPEDAEDTLVTELSSSNELMFEVLLYGDATRYTQFDLVNNSQIIKNALEGSNGISSIDLGGADVNSGAGSSSADDYEIKVLLDRDKVELLNLTLGEISNTIKSYNKNTPIGNYTIGDLNYDFRFDGELANITELKNVVIKGTKGSNILLGDIAEIKREYKDDSIKKLGFLDNKGLNYTSLVFNKGKGSNVFDVSDSAKNALEDYLKSNPNFEGLDIFYTKDMSEAIIEDYTNLSSTAMQTLVLVFITILLFVGLRESLIASMLLPLSFLITFIVLDTLGFSLNFLTNFSLVLTLGIAIDTMIVIIEGASEKIKLGYNKKSAVLLAVKDYKAPLIAGTLTTLVAFLPLMFLPGVMGKFLAYIPITVFVTLVAALILSLTVSSALFVKFVKDLDYYHKDEKLEATFSKNQAEYLAFERQGKREQTHDKSNMRDKVLLGMGLKYYNLLKKVIISRRNRLILIFSPIIILIFTFIFISPQLGFTLFPASDQGVITGSIETKEGTDKRALVKYLSQLDEAIYKIPELKVYYTTLSGNRIDIYIELLQKSIREDMGMRDVFEVEKVILSQLGELESDGLTVSIETLKDGPPTGKAVGIKLIANNSKKVEDLKNTASIFKEKFRGIEGVKNVTTTSSESPGQFIFKFNKDKLAESGLTPNDIVSEVYFYTNGMKAGSIKSEYEDNDVVLKIAQFDENLSPEDINNLLIDTRIGKVRVGDFATYEFTKAVSSINREKGKIAITVEADVVSGILPSEIQPALEKIAAEYIYPEGIIYTSGGENEENKDLIVSTFKSLFITLFLIFSILVFQFNSFGQPAVVMYSVVLAMLGVNIGLFLTGNPYSMAFMIGFIALMGVVVNDAIILIDRINKNLEKGIDSLHAVIGAGKTRLQPIIVTTLTTVFGILPLAFKDEFWAGLGYTIVFGLFAGSAMTLFVIPSLYYEVFLRKKENKLTK